MDRVSYLLQLLQRLLVDGRDGLVFCDRLRLYGALLNLIVAKFFELRAEFAAFMVQVLFVVSGTKKSRFQFLQAVDRDSKCRNYLTLRELFAKMLNLDYSVNSPEVLLNLFAEVRGCDSFDLNIMPYLGELATIILRSRTDLIEPLLSIYARICAEKRPLEHVMDKSSLFLRD